MMMMSPMSCTVNIILAEQPSGDVKGTLFYSGTLLFRTCKRGTKYCGWHREMPPFDYWRHTCISYDHFRDSYKLYVDGVKVDSGSFSGDNALEPIRGGGVFVVGQGMGQAHVAQTCNQNSGHFTAPDVMPRIS